MIREKWLNTLIKLKNHEKVTCPVCDSKNVDYGFVVSDKKSEYGFGGVWCSDCNNGMLISRVKTTNENNIRTTLPTINWQ